MRLAYARTSTEDQKAGLDAQIEELKKAGADRIFSEQVSSVAKVRPKLEELLDFARDGDIVIVTKIDRMARSVINFMSIQERLSKKGAALNVLNLGMDTSTPTGRLVLNTLSVIAQFEREIMLERQKEGIKRAHAQGKFIGRKPFALARRDEVLALVKEGMNPTDIAKKLRIGRTSIYRIINATPEDNIKLNATLRRWKAREKNSDEKVTA